MIEETVIKEMLKRGTKYGMDFVMNCDKNEMIEGYAKVLRNKIENTLSIIHSEYGEAQYKFYLTYYLSSLDKYRPIEILGGDQDG